MGGVGGADAQLVGCSYIVVAHTKFWASPKAPHKPPIWNPCTHGWWRQRQGISRLVSVTHGIQVQPMGEPISESKEEGGNRGKDEGGRIERGKDATLKGRWNISFLRAPSA